MEEETRWFICPVIVLLQIADATFVEKKNTAKILFKLWKDDYLHLEVNFISEVHWVSFVWWVWESRYFALPRWSKKEEVPRGRLSCQITVWCLFFLLFCIWVLSCYRNICTDYGTTTDLLMISSAFPKLHISTSELLFFPDCDDFLFSLQKIVATGSRQTQFFLWKVNKQSLWGHALDEMYHAALNLRIRNALEQEQGKEVCIMLIATFTLNCLFWPYSLISCQFICSIVPLSFYFVNSVGCLASYG